MKVAQSNVAKLALLAAVLGPASRAGAFSGYYTGGVGSTQACTTCHTPTVNTCNGCHAHGTHADSGKATINIVASADKATYAPGETVTVTVAGGYRAGWVRVNLYDQGMTQLARVSCPGGLGGCTTALLPATLTAPAPTAPGTYTWRAAWYGNAAEAATGFTSPACGAPVTPPCFRVDPNNNAAGAVHGEEIVAVTQFTVAAAAAPKIAVSATSLAFGDVTVGATGTKTFTISNEGGATLTGTVALGAGTGAVFSATPATFSIVAGGQPVTVTATYAPTAVGAATGTLVVASNDSASPTVDVALTGAGVSTPVPGIAVTPASLDFGAVAVGGTTTRTLTIQNAGTATLHVTGIALGSGTSSEYSWSPAAPITVAAGASATLTVTYAPTDAGTDSGTLVLTSDAPSSPTSVPVTGSGGAEQPPHKSSGGCSAGGGVGTAGGLALAVLALVLARRRRARMGGGSAT